MSDSPTPFPKPGEPKQLPPEETEEVATEETAPTVSAAGKTFREMDEDESDPRVGIDWNQV